ncbi:bifunctional indole-3-glycerol-phosphate synthase TrpC/phosphoribosylanthranilate isomerase TrpF [Ferrimonas sediminicola]|uniref:Multifunctional fusion protein n=1 Tax=Ferrimonas sediminicola TaxID=2569538 RepID=A0A4U1BFR9_9GAMM|nr:bifunctional indole-3-glycerol-phosphate synthase TrpC/phosphoribosylanthranilate isomerase TrpF [Ferrimonas sediminicola]TKB49977.1 bifunctional indole-3-glycerol-phosphate synthase TrpC/phosphoribosylanthranilate isomerase TrpF [Ferrimonas sediminicola]
MSTILGKIVATKAQHIRRLDQRYGELLRSRAAPSDRSLYDALKGGNTGFILECKKASPSKGLIRPKFDPVAIATTYDKYAAAISVLTDEQFFQGDFEYLKAVRSAVGVPVLCKDFVVDRRQLRLARHMGADAALLMLSVLDDEQYLALAEEAEALALDILTEVSNETELERAIGLGARIIGINNRDLRDLSVDLATTERLAPKIPQDRVVISESGIASHSDVRRLAPLADAFLVGSQLTAQTNIDQACRQLIFGENKVCGLTREADVKAVAEAGALYGGLIFAAKSPRCVTPEQAANLRQAADLRFVGVFVNESADTVARLANDLKLHAVQLHGVEDETYIDALRPLLGGAQVWKAVKPDGSNRVTNADRLLFDSARAGQFGGTGTPFDWSLVGNERRRAMLAGGLSPDNVQEAAAAGFLGLDLNSGLESAPGLKDQDKIAQAFAGLRHY